jgi:hypothetical protein
MKVQNDNLQFKGEMAGGFALGTEPVLCSRLYNRTKIHFYFGIDYLLLSISIMFSILFFVPSLRDHQKMFIYEYSSNYQNLNYSLKV